MPATIRDVAKLAGASVGAVSAVLSDTRRHNIRVGLATRERIRAAAAQLEYTPNPIAQMLVTRKAGVLGLVFPYTEAFIDRNPFCTQVMAGIFEEVVRERYNLMLHTATGANSREDAESMMLDPRVDGLILVLPPSDSTIISRCQQRGFPCVAVVCKNDLGNVCTINADEFSGGRMAAEHLIGLGHRRIAHLAGDPKISTSEPRREGYLAALAQAGIEIDPELITGQGFDYRDGQAGMAHLLSLPEDRRPTAVFAANDLSADGALRLLHERGLRVPEDVAVVGYDDTWFAQMTKPNLTSVRMPIYEMGMLAAQMLIAMVEGREIADRQPILPVSLSIRESTQPLTSSSDRPSNHSKENFLCQA